MIVYEVINLETEESHGQFETIDEARGCVAYDHLKAYQIDAKDKEFIRTVDGRYPDSEA